MSQQLPERRSRLMPERWQPMTEFDQLMDRMRRMLDQTFGDFGWPSRTEGVIAAWSPPVDIEEADDAYVVAADLPGVNRQDVKIEIVGNELMITGDVKEREHTGEVRRQMRRSGHFEYRLRLPTQVNADNVEATLKEGVLTVRAPKSEKEQRRQIEVKG
jgi:HSP20 family protein